MLKKWIYEKVASVAKYGVFDKAIKDELTNVWQQLFKLPHYASLDENALFVELKNIARSPRYRISDQQLALAKNSHNLLIGFVIVGVRGVMPSYDITNDDVEYIYKHIDVWLKANKQFM